MSKYDWDFIPSEILFAATDSLGRKLGFINKPKCSDDFTMMNADYLISEYESPIKNWRESLEKRPCSDQ